MMYLLMYFFLLLIIFGNVMQDITDQIKGITRLETDDNVYKECRFLPLLTRSLTIACSIIQAFY